jgi:octaprenyl-diphosphate synthase
MSAEIDKIKQPVKQEVEQFEAYFKNAMKSNVPLLNLVTGYILKRKGKQMRPLFVFLCAKMLGTVCDSTNRAAAMIELLHTATLVHDDIVDDSNKRRGFFSINALWKNKIAVLVGDFLLSRGLLLALENEEYQLLRTVSTAVKEMSEGELLQIEKARKLDISEEIYFEIIRKKTASLIASCCACGATSVNSDPETISKMQKFGEYVGIAFQLKDDLFDYEKNNQSGKPYGADIKEQKMTLPLIFSLSQMKYSEKRKVINIVKNNSNNKEKVNFVIQRVYELGGISYASEKMKEYHHKALDLLYEFPKNDVRDSLEKLVNYVIERKK